jgi:Fe-S-cluster containining protein
MAKLIETRAQRRRRLQHQSTKSSVFAHAALNKLVNWALKKRPCQRCGACCSAYSIGLTQADIEAEPRLVEKSRPMAEITDLGTPPLPDETYFIVGTGRGKICPFLDVNSKLCSIYATRPRTCRRFFSSAFMCKLAHLERLGANMLKTICEWDAMKMPKENIILAIMCISEENVKRKLDKSESQPDKRG